MSQEQATGSFAPKPYEFTTGVVLSVLVATAFIYTTVAGNVELLTDLHITVGTVWTVVVLGYGFVVAPVLDGRDTAGRIAVLTRLVPVTVVLLPALTLFTIGAGLQLAVTHDLFADPSLLLSTVLVLTAAIVAIAFGVVLRNDIRLYRGLRADNSETERLAQLGTRNARVLTVQGTVQTMMLFLMYQLSGQLA